VESEISQVVMERHAYDAFAGQAQRRRVLSFLLLLWVQSSSFLVETRQI